MPDFIIDGIHLTIPADRLTDALVRSLQAGRYENTEAAAIKTHLRPDDRLLDLGAGAGYLLAQAARIVSDPGALAGVEASPEMAEVARATLARCGAAAARIRWGAVVPDDHAEPEVAFLQRRAFWASGLAAKAPPAADGPARRLMVPALRFGALLAEHRPTVLSIDIEGAEAALFDRPLPAPLRLVVIEIHPALYGLSGTRRIFDGLSASGFAYDARRARGATIVFSRIDGA